MNPLNVVWGVIAALLLYGVVKWMAFSWLVALVLVVGLLYVASRVLPPVEKAVLEWRRRLGRALARFGERIDRTRDAIGRFMRAIRHPGVLGSAAAGVGVVLVAPVALPLVAPSAGIEVPAVYQRVLLQAVPFLVGWTDPEPSYYAFVAPRFADPKGDSDALVVGEGVPTTFRFRISPTWWAASLIKQTPDRRIIGSADDVGLTVKMSCSFCRPHPAFVRHITYRAKDRSSDFVEFSFVPIVPNGEDAGSAATPRRLVVSVHHDASGQEYDRISIPVAIASGAAPRIDSERLAVARNVSTPVTATAIQAADVVLLAYEHLDGQVRVQVQPIRADLKARMANLVVDGAGRWREFTTNVRGQKAIEKITTAAYGSVSQIILPTTSGARRSGDVVVSDRSIETSRLTPDEAAKIGDVLATTGQELYARLFVEAPDAALGQAIALLEADGAGPTPVPPLTVLVYTDLSLPWQYLLPVGANVDASRFWGLRFNLEIQRTNLSIPPLRDGGVADPPTRFVFAKFAVENDASVRYAQQQIESLRLFGTVEVVESAKALVDVFKTGRRNIAAVVAFLHAASAQPSADGGGSTAAPRLYFAPKDWIEVRELEGLRNRRSAEEIRADRRFLSGAPLVILNACESGPSTIALPHSTLEAAMLELGAQGVIATEVPVWIPLAHEVGSRLIERLKTGESASAALTAVRRELYEKNNNPLGLLYAYYGGPGTTLRR
jgi:hypothetical protein